MKKYMPLEGLRWSRDSGSTLCDTPQNGRSRTGWGRVFHCVCLKQIRNHRPNEKTLRLLGGSTYNA